MSSYTLVFQSVKIEGNLTDAVLRKGVEIAEMVFKYNNRWRVDLLQFVFCTIANIVVPEKGTYKNLNIDTFYKASGGKNELLTSDEIGFCDKLNSYLSQSLDRKEYKKRIGTLYELYICHQKKSSISHAIIYHESKAKLNKNNISFGDNSTSLDVIVDEREKVLKISLIECTLSTVTFIKNRKDDELKLYHEVCKEIRNVDKDIILTLELSAACGGKYSIEDYTSHLIHDLRKINVLVYGVESNTNTRIPFLDSGAK